MLRTLAVARLLLGNMNIQAPPNLTPHRIEKLLEGGINDWGGVSPLTPDYINPEAPWPHLLELQRRTEATGQTLKQRLPVYPGFVPWVQARGGFLADKLAAAIDEHRTRGLLDGGRITGGTGGTKLVQGLQQVIAPEDLTVIVNTGDDIGGGGCMFPRTWTPSCTVCLACSYRPWMGRGQ